MATIASPILSNGLGANIFSRDGPVVGGPNYPSTPLVRGDIIGSINNTNNKLTHACDFAISMEKQELLNKYKRSIVDWIRQLIVKIQNLLDFEPSGQFSALINKLKGIAEYIAYVNREIIQPIIEFTQFVLAVVVKIRAIIQWILSLPAKFLALVKECLGKLLAQIGSLFFDEWAGTAISPLPASDAGKDFSELASAAKGVYDQTASLLNNTAVATGAVIGIAASLTIGLVEPVSEEELQNADATILAFNASIPPAAAVPADANHTPDEKP